MLREGGPTVGSAGQASFPSIDNVGVAHCVESALGRVAKKPSHSTIFHSCTVRGPNPTSHRQRWSCGAGLVFPIGE